MLSFRCFVHVSPSFVSSLNGSFITIENGNQRNACDMSPWKQRTSGRALTLAHSETNSSSSTRTCRLRARLASSYCVCSRPSPKLASRCRVQNILETSIMINSTAQSSSVRPRRKLRGPHSQKSIRRLQRKHQSWLQLLIDMTSISHTICAVALTGEKSRDSAMQVSMSS